MADVQGQPRSFWDRPEGSFAKFFTPVVLIGGGIAVFMFWATILPFLLMVVTNTIYLALGVAFLALFLYACFDPTWRAVLTLGYRALMRAMVSTVIELDPIGIMKGYMKEAKEQFVHAKEKKASLDGQREALKNEIIRSKEEKEQRLLEARAAQKKPEFHDAYLLAAQQAGQLDEAIKQYEAQDAQMDEFAKSIDRICRATEMMIKDLDFKVKLEGRKRKMLLAGFNVMNDAKSLLSEGGTKREMFDDALNFVVEDYGAKMGQIKSFVRDVEGTLQQTDLKNGVYEERAAEQIAALNQKSQDILVRVDTSSQKEPETVGALDDIFTAPQKRAAR